ncbi:MAG: 2TM domain-containing protein [Armatimonadetes bacterium]|nr:2TM domain-containing protein [Armatimonadota bacterium]
MDDARDRLTTDEDVDEILKLAVRRQGGSHGDLRARMLEAADELGISDSDLQQAEDEYLQQKIDRDEFDEFRRKQRREFRQHLFCYVVTNALLVGIDVMADGGIDWAMWSILGWGIGIASHAWATLNSDSQPFQEEFEKFRDKKRRRARNRPV